MDETQRQRELDRYRVVDSLPDEAYDDIVRVAAAVCRTPTALVSMIDRGRQWFKARHGFDEQETRREDAFCNHAIQAPDRLFEVPNAEADPRFADNPFVDKADGIRFYAGMPLVTPAGAPIGTVCVIDRVPRSLDEAQREALSALARLTMNLIESRRRERELERQIQLAAGGDAAAPLPPSHCTVVIFEVQQAGAAAARLGERTLEKLLHGLSDALEARLANPEDSVSRVSGCAELIVVLHGLDTAAQLAELRRAAAEFEHQHGLRVLSASSQSETADERLEYVYVRADEALTQAKNAAA